MTRRLLISAVILVLALPCWGAQWFVDASMENNDLDGEQTIVMPAGTISEIEGLAMFHSGGVYVIEMASIDDSVVIANEVASGRNILHVAKAGDTEHCWLQVTEIDSVMLTCSRFGTDGDDLSGEASIDLIGTGPEQTIAAGIVDASSGGTNVVHVTAGTYAETRITFGSSQHGDTITVQALTPTVKPVFACTGSDPITVAAACFTGTFVWDGVHITTADVNNSQMINVVDAGSGNTPTGSWTFRNCTLTNPTSIGAIFYPNGQTIVGTRSFYFDNVTFSSPDNSRAAWMRCNDAYKIDFYRCTFTHGKALPYLSGMFDLSSNGGIYDTISVRECSFSSEVNGTSANTAMIMDGASTSGASGGLLVKDCTFTTIGHSPIYISAKAGSNQRFKIEGNTFTMTLDDDITTTLRVAHEATTTLSVIPAVLTTALIGKDVTVNGVTREISAVSYADQTATLDGAVSGAEGDPVSIAAAVSKGVIALGDELESSTDTLGSAVIIDNVIDILGDDSDESVGIHMMRGSCGLVACNTVRGQQAHGNTDGASSIGIYIRGDRTTYFRNSVTSSDAIIFGYSRDNVVIHNTMYSPHCDGTRSPLIFRDARLGSPGSYTYYYPTGNVVMFNVVATTDNIGYAVNFSRHYLESTMTPASNILDYNVVSKGSAGAGFFAIHGTGKTLEELTSTYWPSLGSLSMWNDIGTREGTVEFVDGLNGDLRSNSTSIRGTQTGTPNPTIWNDKGAWQRRVSSGSTPTNKGEQN